MAIITLGRIDKKLIFLVFVTIVRTIDLVITYEIQDDYSIDIILTFVQEIGAILLGIILLFIFKQKLQKKESKRKSFKYFIYFLILRTVKSCYEKMYGYFVKEKKYKWNNLLNTINGVEIFLMTLGTFILLKYKYYIHHYISMTIYCALGIISDFILGSFSMMNYKYIYIYLIYFINEVMIFCYMKYMMDKLYYHYTELLLIWGIVGVIIKVLIYSGIIIYEYENNIEGVVNDWKTYFSETNIFTIIFLQFVYFIIDGGIYYLLTLLELYYLRPNHMLINDEINIYEDILFYAERQNKMYSLIIFLLQMFAMLFYYEILELNFWGLNKNTAKSIKIRERTESVMRESNVSEIELGDQYYVKHDKTRTSDEDLNVTNDRISNQTSTQKCNLSNEEIALLEENNSNKD